MANFISACSSHEGKEELDLIPHDDFEPLFTIGDEHPTMENLVKKGHILLNGLDVKKEVGPIQLTLDEVDIFQDVKTDQYYYLFRLSDFGNYSDQIVVFDLHNINYGLQGQAMISTNKGGVKQRKIEPNPIEIYVIRPNDLLMFTEIMFPVSDNHPENIEFITLHLPEAYTIDEEHVTFPESTKEALAQYFNDLIVESAETDEDENEEIDLPGNLYRGALEIAEYLPPDKPEFDLEYLEQVADDVTIHIETNKRLELEE